MNNKLIKFAIFSSLFFSSLSFSESNMPTKKTYCIGRHLIDISSDAEIKGASNEYIATKIKSEKMSKSDFSLLLTNKEKILKLEPSTRNYQLTEVSYPLDKDKRIFISSRTVFNDKAFGIDTYKHTLYGMTFMTSGRSFDDVKINHIIKMYENYLNQLRYRKSSEIPKEAGFCFEEGFVANDGLTSQNEQASLHFEFKTNPDVVVNIETTVVFKADQTLLERINATDFGAKLRVIRKGKREVNGRVGEEYLVQVPSDDGHGKAYLFFWEAQGKNGDPLQPQLHFEFLAGSMPGSRTVDSSISEKQAIEWYEQIVKTIRFRPI